MNLDEAKELWSSHTPTDAPEMNAHSLSESEILQLVREKSRSFDRKIWRRDLLESAAALFVFVAFGWMAWDASGLARAGALVVMGSSVFIFWTLRRARTRPATPDPNHSVADVLRSERAKVDAQIRLLETVARWYIAPLATGMILLIAGFDGWSMATLIQTGVVFAAGYGIYALNQYAVENDLAPRRRELTTLIEQVTGEAS